MKDRGFTLIELLVSISVISTLIGILIPTLHGAREQARLVSCASSQRQLLIGISTYAADNDFKLPHGPTTMSPFGVRWSEFPGGLLWTGAMSHEFTGAGVLMNGYIESTESYFCAGEDFLKADEQLANIGTDATAVGSYAYRSLSDMTGLFMGDLGDNSEGRPATCLLYDAQLVGAGEGFDHTTHGGKALCLGYEDGHVQMVDDTAQEFVFIANGQPDLFARMISEPNRLFMKADRHR